MSSEMESSINPAEQLVWHRGKAYRKGYTTGSCATAAAKVAALMVMRQQAIHQVSIVTPSGIELQLAVEQVSVEPSQAIAAVRKDGGDDVDATHGMLIFAKVSLLPEGCEIVIEGGAGIGVVTRKGIGLEVGEAAINKTPRHTITQAVREAIGPQLGARVEIFAPEGAERAKRTYNARLGIQGGISIIGTTGIVTPMSEESWKRSLAIELEQKRASGLEQVIMVPGNHGERFVEQQLLLPTNALVTMSNFVGYMLQEAQRLGFGQVVLAGHIGKLVKVAAGVFHTHSHIADGRMETLVTHLALLNAPHELLKQVYHCVSTEEALELIDQAGFQVAYSNIAKQAELRVQQMLKYADKPLNCDVVLFSMQGEVLGSNRPIADIQTDFLCSTNNSKQAKESRND